MLVTTRVKAVGIFESDYPKPKPGERPGELFEFIDRDARKRSIVSLRIDRDVVLDHRPAEDEWVDAELQVEQVAKAVVRQDREDAGRTYNAAAEQLVARVVNIRKAAKPAAKADDRAKVAA